MQLSQWMKEQKLSVNAMSKKCGIPRQTINNARSGNIDIALRTAMTIVKFTKNEVTYDDLARESQKNDKSDKDGHQDEHDGHKDSAV